MRSLSAVVLAAALVLVACGSPANEAAAGGDGAEAVAQDTVSMAKSYVFEPAAIRVEPGTTVTWVNDDNFTHTVRIADEVIGDAAPGESITYDFQEPGTFSYDCSLHPRDMRGVIHVGS